MSTDYDSPWKEALDEYLEPCFALLFPVAHADIDWSKKPVAQDKELQQITPEAEVGRRYVDKLYRVYLKRGGVGRVFMHMEVQVWPGGGFEERMFGYNSRAYLHYKCPVASLAILGDDDPDWRPTQYSWTVLGCTHLLRFPTAKLLDWAPRWQELEAHPNPFAKVVLAHLKTQETRNDPAARHQWKIRFVRALYEQGLAEKDVRKLFLIIDWLMDLPPALKGLFWREVRQIQEEHKMPFVSTPQWYGRKEGLVEGIKTSLDIKFGDAGLALMPEIERIEEPEQLQVVLRAIKEASSPDDLRRFWTPQP
ncbi:MAG TPA: hypothetical protein VKA46_05655 [Gemmataceae bacterium]|nr:hypothetical protein [Gemmataceae bacterium]